MRTAPKGQRGDAAASFRQLERGPLLPAYLLYGEEGYLVERALDTVLRRVGAGAGAVRLRAGDADLGARAEAGLRTASLFGGVPVVVVLGVDALSEAEQEALLAIMRQDPGAHLLLVGTSPDLRRRLYASCTRQGWAFEFRRLSMARIPAWLREDARSRGHVLDSRAAELLADLVGTDLRVAAAELEKLSLYVGPEQPIDAEAVGAVVGSSRARSMFELGEHIQRRDVAGSVALLRRLLEQGAQPIVLVAVLAGQLRRMAIAGSMASRGASATEVASRLGLPPWVAERIIGGFRRYGAGSARDAITRLTAVDVALKSTRVSPGALLEAYLLDLQA